MTFDLAVVCAASGVLAGGVKTGGDATMDVGVCISSGGLFLV